MGYSRPIDREGSERGAWHAVSRPAGGRPKLSWCGLDRLWFNHPSLARTQQTSIPRSRPRQRSGTRISHLWL